MFANLIAPSRWRSRRTPISRPRACSGRAIEQLESRRLLATVAPGFLTDVSYGGGISSGTAMDFAPDGRLFVTTQNGNVFVIPAGGGAAALALSLTVDSFFERGLLGIAFDPTFDANAPGPDYVYLYYTRPAGAEPVHNRVVRLEVTGNTINAASETLILRLNNLSAGNHNGGGIHFGPDGKLYVAVGENAVGSNSQTVTNLHGKMLRINADPVDPIPNDNPPSFIVRQGGVDITVMPTGQNRAIWAVGLRNPYTFAFQPDTGRMHINDVGQSSWEEINVGAPAANYGWNLTEGDFNQGSFPNFTRPLYAYPNDATTSAIVGGSFYNTPAHTFPAEFTGDYFFADLSGNWIRRLDAANNYAFQSTGGVSNGPNFLQGASNPVDIKIGPDGGVYFLQRGGGNGGAGVRVVRPIDPSPYVVNRDFEFTGMILPNAPHRVNFSFSENVGASVDPADLMLENLTTNMTVPTGNIAVSYDNGTNTATFTFPGYPSGILPDGNYRATLLASGVTDASGQPIAENQVFEFFFLNGDANRDKVVNLDDFNTLASNFGLSGAEFTDGDFTYDGLVNLDDFNVLASRFGMMLSSPSPALASRPSPFGQTRIVDSQQEDEETDLLA